MARPARPCYIPAMAQPHHTDVPHTTDAPGRLLFSGHASRPWPSLVFLSPLLAFYTLGLVWVRPDLAAGADLLLRRALEPLGLTGILAPAAAVVVVLLAWQVATRGPWRFPVRLLGAMAAETALLAVPLLALCAAFYTVSARAAELAFPAIPVPPDTGWLELGMTSVGAGIYEELLFRLVLVGGLVLLARHVVGLDPNGAIVAAVLVAAALFAGAHTLDNPRAFTWPSFLWRTAAGVYLSLVFAYRGFGIAAGVHIAWNLAVKALVVAVPLA